MISSQNTTIKLVDQFDESVSMGIAEFMPVSTESQSLATIEVNKEKTQKSKMAYIHKSALVAALAFSAHGIVSSALLEDQKVDEKNFADIQIDLSGRGSQRKLTFQDAINISVMALRERDFNWKKAIEAEEKLDMEYTD